MDEENRQVLIRKCCMFKMSMSKFESRGLDNDGVSCLFVDNKQAEAYNEYQISKLQTNNACKIAKITEVNSVRAHRLPKDRQTAYLINFFGVWVQKFY